MARNRPRKHYDVRIPTFDWKQIGGDMSPGQHGGTIARADGDSIELLKIQPVRDYVGEREAAEVGHPFWTRESYFDESDLQTDREEVIDALNSIGVWDSDDQLQAFEEATPEQRGLLIAEALQDYGHADEGPAGWAKDVLSVEVEWWDGKKAGWEYIADEDEEFMTEVLGAISWDHPGTVQDVFDELWAIREEIAADPEITETDVRLQVDEGSWTVHFGDAQYDTDHSGYWGASSVSVEDSDEALRETARALIDEARDAWHEDHPEAPTLERNARHARNAGRTNKRGHVLEPGTWVRVYEQREGNDRWTAVLDGKDWNSSATGRNRVMMGITDGGGSYFTEGMEGRHLGKEVPWDQVPGPVRRAIETRARQSDMKANARGGSVDEHAARELELFIENDYALVGAPNSQGKSIEKNLEKKIAKGKFDFALSVKLWGYLMETGAKKYAQEYGDGRDWHQIFSPATRRFVAERFARSFAQERGQLVQNGASRAWTGGRRHKLSRRPGDATSGPAGLYQYGPATIWVSGPISGTWYATVKYARQEKDVDGKSIDEVLGLSMDVVDAYSDRSNSRRA